MIKYRAEILVNYGDQPPFDFHADLCDYKSIYFEVLEDAQLWAAKNDIDHEGKVYHEEEIYFIDDYGKCSYTEVHQTGYCYLDDGKLIVERLE